MDTFKLYVFLLTCITLIFVQNNVDAAPGTDCSADSTVCDTSNNEICTGTTCVCDNGFYESGTSCVSTNALRPTSLSSNAQTHNSVSLTWTSPDAPGYANSYVINYNELGGSSSQSHNVNNQDVFTTVSNLSPGKTYSFTVVRSITKYGRYQNIQTLDPVQAATKRDYGSACTGDQCRNILSCITGKCLCADGRYYTADSCISKRDYGSACTGDQCRNILSCITGKCLCADGRYYTADSCISIVVLQPSISGAQATSTTSVTVNWNSPPAAGYTNSYVIKYTELGSSDVRNNTLSGNVLSHLVTGLKAGTSYTFIVVRSITREGRTQQVIDSSSYVGISEKINYAEPCVSKGTCKGTQTDCYSLTCRCNPGNFWNGITCLPNANLSPGNVDTETLSTTQLRVTWTPSAYPGIVTGYLVDLSPAVPSENIVINGTSAIISSLTPGERYSITVSSSSSYLNRGETAAAPVVYGITKPAATVGVAPATSLMEPTAQIYFYKAEGRADSFTVMLTRDGYSMVQTASGTGDIYSVSFPGVVAGLSYNLTVITISYGVSSDPFSKMIRIRAKAPSFLASERPVIQVVSGTETEKTVELLICPTCLLDNTNGLIVKSGVQVCAKGDCPIRSADELMTADSFDESPNWDTTAGVGFSTWYRATEDDWLKGKEASDEIRFVLGEESCGVQDQNRFCNGPLPVDRTYRVWLFACTRVSCAEGDHVEFTLGINNDDSLSGSIIAAIVIVAVLIVLTVVILVVYIKVIRPRSQRKRSTQYVSDTSRKNDTYAEIGDGNRMSVIKDGQPEVDYYNTTDSPPRSENTYDQLTVYSNQGQHDYGKIKVTQT